MIAFHLIKVQYDFEQIVFVLMQYLSTELNEWYCYIFEKKNLLLDLVYLDYTTFSIGKITVLSSVSLH